MVFMTPIRVYEVSYGLYKIVWKTAEWRGKIMYYLDDLHDFSDVE